MISPAPAGLLRRLRVPGYLILALALAFPLADLLVQTMPLKPTQVVWRFGAMGLFSGAVAAPILILFFIYALALLSGDRKVIIAVIAISAILALILLGGSGAFALDALQMKRRVQAAAQPRFTVAAAQAMAKLLLQGLASVVLAVSALVTVRGTKAAPVRVERPSGPNLIVGSRGAALRNIQAPTPTPAEGSATIDAPTTRVDE
ncbi:MAG: hypothetical protein JWM95_4195 [Gemmatimonadetes bacterium]|nr:hypothetical protein [Gemmatimonadota bacterium]